MKVRLHPERNRERRLAFHLAFACALAIHFFAFASVSSAQSTIGLYTDATGNSCSFPGNSPGLVTAYVVVHPDQYGISAVQFAAPVPACLGATYVSETLPAGVLGIGNSQTGISIALEQCRQAPTSVLSITYLRAGSTDPCCTYDIVPDPSVGQLTAADCFFNEVPLTSVHSHFNADGSCACEGNSAPSAPTNPAPTEGESAVSVHASLEWDAFDRDNDIVDYDLYLGVSPTPPLVAAGLISPTYTPAAPFAEFTTYYWRVVVRDAHGVTTSGATWSFTTRAVNSPPLAPIAFYPLDGAATIPIQATLAWGSTDVDGDALTYDIHFGDANPPPLAASALTIPRYSPPAMTFATTYYWRVVVRDVVGHETSGPTWAFTTRPENLPPNVPTLVAPPNGSGNRPVTQQLEWTQSDADNDTLESDLYFGDTPNPPLLATHITFPHYSPVDMQYATTYYWRVVVRDHRGAETSGPEWTFVTRPANYPPVAPSSPSPTNGSTTASETPTLTWQSSDQDGHAITYDVYFGTANPPPLLATNVATKSFSPGVLAFTTTYRWRIVARDELGAETSGPQWSFTTRTNLPPDIPFGPVPSTGSSNRPINQTLAWQCNDPNSGQALTFDVYFGTAASPPLVASNVTAKSFNPGPLAFVVTYRWRIVARDPFGLERAGPTWSFTTKANVAPSTPSNPTPPNNGASGLTPLLAWNSTDPDGQVITYDIFFGTVNPPPLVASGVTANTYDPGPLAAGNYFWRILASDGIVFTSGPVWSFVATTMGDANLDGSVTVQDAWCAFDAFVGKGACQGNPRADVDCSGQVTPGDARCIHLHALDESCLFCGEGGFATAATTAPPYVYVSQTFEDHDTVVVRLGVTGIPSVSAFGFFLYSDNTWLVGSRARGVSNSFDRVGSGAGPYAWAGGYSVAGASVGTSAEFIELRFLPMGSGSHSVSIGSFLDDLAGAPEFNIHIDGGGSVPVLISSFDARVVDRGVEVSWVLQSDEALDTYTLFRRQEGADNPIVISQGRADGARSYLDTSVDAATTYHYELLIRTADGDEFRSRIATAATQSISLSLGQNHPNPFNPQTVIPYQLPASSKSERVRLWILDISGRVVKTLVDENQAGGSYRVEWTGKDDRGESVSSGVYFYVLDFGGERRTRKLVLLK